MKLTKSFFELTEKQTENSILFYGKIIKCLIAPYHTINTIPLESNDTIYVYPERDLNIEERKNLLNVILKSDKKEICFVTSDLFIITDMINDCTRLLTQDEQVIEISEKIFSANPHTIINSVLKNNSSKPFQQNYINLINNLISVIKTGKMSKKEYNDYKKIIDNIGEPLISNQLNNMLSNVEVV